MKTLAINQQKPSSEMWLDENNTAIPYKRVTPFERKSEKQLSSVAKAALDLNNRLTAFKNSVKEVVLDLFEDFLKENDGKASKGNITLFNFDRSIKVELDAKYNIVLDESYVNMAKAELEDLITDGLTGAQEWIEPIIMEAFSTTGGRLDVKKVLGMKKHQSRVNQSRFNKAMEFIDKGTRRVFSKQYYRIYVRDAAGEYQSIKLNFSDIETED